MNKISLQVGNEENTNILNKVFCTKKNNSTIHFCNKKCYVMFIQLPTKIRNLEFIK